jgi:hypothetical protein
MSCDPQIIRRTIQLMRATGSIVNRDSNMAKARQNDELVGQMMLFGALSECCGPPARYIQYCQRGKVIAYLRCDGSGQENFCGGIKKAPMSGRTLVGVSVN